MRRTGIRRLLAGVAVAASLGGMPACARMGAQHGGSAPVSFELFFVALNPTQVRGETIGCGDVLVSRPHTAALAGSPLETAVRAQLSAPAPDGLVNRVAQLHVALRSVRIKGRHATVTLEPFSIGGVCDHPRIEEQLTRVVRQFGAFDHVDIFVGDRTLAQYLSLK